MITKKDLADKIRRKFGHPVVKVELDQRQIYDAIDEARGRFIKWAVGQATHEVFYTMLLSGGQPLYDMPLGTTEILSYEDKGGLGGINTLFTIENYLYTNGFFDGMLYPGGSPIGGSSYTGYNLISYHIAMDFLDTVRRYTPSQYNFRYHRYTNEIEIIPTPPSGGSFDFNGTTVDSPGIALVRCFTIEGSTTASTWTSALHPEQGPTDTDQSFYDTDWIFEYAFAECKERIGYIRRKFENFAAIGNTGIQMDGGDMISESRDEKTELMVQLKDEEAYEGWGISIGY